MRSDNTGTERTGENWKTIAYPKDSYLPEKIALCARNTWKEKSQTTSSDIRASTQTAIGVMRMEHRLEPDKVREIAFRLMDDENVWEL